PTTGFAAQQNDWNLRPTVVNSPGGALFFCNNCLRVAMIGNLCTQTVSVCFNFSSDDTVTGIGSIKFLSNTAYDTGHGLLMFGDFQTFPTDNDSDVYTNSIIRNNRCRGTGRRFGGEACILHLIAHDTYIGHNQADHTYGVAFGICVPTNAKCIGG